MKVDGFEMIDDPVAWSRRELVVISAFLFAIGELAGRTTGTMPSTLSKIIRLVDPDAGRRTCGTCNRRRGPMTWISPHARGLSLIDRCDGADAFVDAEGALRSWCELIAPEGG